MHGTTSQRVTRLVTHLVTHPLNIPRYASSVPLLKRSPLDAEIPWISYGAIDFLSRHLTRDMIVFEWGAGGSTLYFAKRVKRLISCEDDVSWFDVVRQRVEQNAIGNVEMHLHPFDFARPERFGTSSYYNALPDGVCDVILVDGQEHQTPVRPTCFRLAEQRVKPGGIVVVDDSWRYPELRANNQAKKHAVFQSVGPCRYGVTSTDVFFY